MVYLLLAIVSSAMVSVIMRLSSEKVSGDVSLLAMNYLSGMLIAGFYTGAANLVPLTPALPKTLLLGMIHGFLYLGTFMLLQLNQKKNGVVLSAIFMKLGLLVPMAVSMVFFKEMPALIQLIGFVIAVFAIILINFERGETALQFRFGLLLLLLGSGFADVMSKIYEEVGDPALSSQFLFYTFVAAFVVCILLMKAKKQRPGLPEVFFGALIGVPNYFSAKFLLRALVDVPAVIAYPTYSVATILLITLVGVAFFREKLSRRQWKALGVILLALVLLNL